jgi:predicted Zn-dependent protease
MKSLLFLAPGALLIASLATVVLLPRTAQAHGATADQLEQVSHALEHDPGDAQLYIRRATLRQTRREWAGAIEDLDRAARLAPQLPVVDLARGRLLLDAGRPAEARRALDSYVRRAGDDPQGWLERARANVGLGEPLAAARDYRAAMERLRDPGPDIVLEHADALLAAGDGHRVQALQVVESGIARQGPLLTLQLKAADIELSLGQHDAALRRFEQLAAQSPRKERWQLRRGDVLRSAGRPQEARAAYLAAMASIESLPPHLLQVPATVDLKQRVSDRLATL